MAESPQATSPDFSGGWGRRDLEQILLETKALAHQLNQTKAALHRVDGLPACGQRLLEILNVHGRQTVPSLARLSLTSRQNVQIAINRLKATGWVEVVPNPEHKRSVLLALTEAGRKLLVTAAAREEALWDRLVADVSETEASATIALFRKIQQALAETRAQEPAARERSDRTRLRSAARRGTRAGKAAELSSDLPESADSAELPVSLL